MISFIQHFVKVVLRSKNTFIFSSDFKTLFTKQSPREILGLNFEKKTVYLNFNFPSFTQRAVCEHSLFTAYGLFSVQHGSFKLSDSQTRVLHN